MEDPLRADVAPFQSALRVSVLARLDWRKTRLFFLAFGLPEELEEVRLPIGRMETTVNR